ncbi:MAG TPA: nucleoside monophosphate kinase [Candidatus Saccharibacteria bacterium]|nr:nucleoside monophosphate kinase [Candidatus Saccharibacteria bacterium]HRK93855.1 nucleoside monophosphate kinase [Candidatus Saccharibacteria bacterium]
MSKKSIITIAGKPGSGKSTTSKAVAAQLSYRHFSSGDLFRAIAKEKGLDVKSANQHAEKESSIDDLVDSKLQQMGKTESDIVIDSRTAWHWMPDSFKVYLDLNLETAADRILNSLDRGHEANEYIPESVQEYAKELAERLESEAKRYKKLYGINPYDLSNYDLVVDTSSYTIDETVDKVISAFKSWLTS